MKGGVLRGRRHIVVAKMRRDYYTYIVVIKTEHSPATTYTENVVLETHPMVGMPFVLCTMKTHSQPSTPLRPQGCLLTNSQEGVN